MRVLSIGIGVAAAVAALGCEGGGDSGQAWSKFALCVAGEGIEEPDQVPGRLRSVELAERKPPGAGDQKTQWPGRCAPHADALFNSLGSGTEDKLLKRALTSQLACKSEEEQPGCKFPDRGSVLADATAVWQAAKIAGLALDPAVKADVPSHDVVFDDTSKWTALAGKQHELAGTHITQDGRLRLMFKSREAPTVICDAKGDSAKCAPVSGAVPNLSYQSITLLDDDEPIISGLTEDGRKAFSAESGQELPFYGAGDAARRDGVLVEEGEEGKGFIAILGAGGKKRGDAYFEAAVTRDNPPVGIGAFASWVEGEGDQASWHFGKVAGKALNQVANFSGSHTGYLHPCSTAAGQSLGVWDRAKGERDAKPTSGKEETSVSASFLQEGAWTEPVTANIPFNRRFTGWRCDGDKISVYWAQAEDNQLQVGRVACQASGCKVEKSEWPGFTVKRWLLAGEAGGKFVAAWTTELGDTRRRVGNVSDFANAEERILYEEQERGGPVFVRAKSVFVGANAYLLVFDQGPVLLRVDDQGSVSSVSAK